MKILGILAIVAIVLLALFYEGKRRDQLAVAATNLGLDFERGQQGLPKALDQAGFYLFTQGPAQMINAMRGRRDDYELLVFGYGFSAAFGDEGQRALPNSDDDSRIERRLQTVVWLRSDAFRLPDFDLSPTRGPKRSAAAQFGMQPVGFDGNQGFRGAYRLAAREPEAARRHFIPEVLDYLTAHPGLVLEGRGGQWLFYRPEERAAPERIGELIDQAEALIGLLRPQAE